MFHRLTRPGQRRTILSLFVISLSVMAVLASPYWTVYDSMHPKRAAVQYTYNVSNMLAELILAHHLGSHC